MPLSTWTATSISVARRSSVSERSSSPITRLYRLIAASARARVVQIGNDLLDQRAHDALLQARVGGRRGPDGLEVRGQAIERDGVDGGNRLRHLVSRDLGFYLAHARERRVPPRLQLARHQPVGRVGGIVLAEGAVGGIARRFEIAAKRLAHLVASLYGLLLRRRRCGDGAGTDHAQQGLLDRVVGAQSAEGDAARFALVQPAPAAAVAEDGVLGAGVAKRQLAPAAMATDQPRE